jgi:hypothetical protein
MESQPIKYLVQCEDPERTLTYIPCDDFAALQMAWSAQPPEVIKTLYRGDIAMTVTHAEAKQLYTFLMPQLKNMTREECDQWGLIFTLVEDELGYYYPDVVAEAEQ